METLYFITASGVCGYKEEWDANELEVEAFDWIQEWGDRIGTGVAKLPSGGAIDLRQFATVSQTR